jgi:acyl-CoA reductase-like NAD-dependent aldehyde dehydrogenase
MERSVRVFSSYSAAERADADAWARMSPQERLDLALEIAARYREGLGEAGQGFARVCRVTSFKQG